MNKAQRLVRLNDILVNRSFKENKTFLLNSLNDPDLRFFINRKLPDAIETLESVDYLWKKLIKYKQPFGILDAFSKNLNDGNSEYIVRFLTENFAEIGNEFNGDIFREEAIEVLINVFRRPHTPNRSAARLLREISKYYASSFKKLDVTSSDERERNLVAKLLLAIYELPDEENEELKDKVIKIIWRHFNVVGDDGEFSFYTPQPIFKILLNFVSLDFNNNFFIVVRKIIAQYQRIEWKNEEYTGWELVGSGISQSGENYSIVDRHYIIYLLTPALEDFYSHDHDKAWEFIIDRVITTSEACVSKTKPDFLNRAAIKLIVKEYLSGSNSEQAFNILKSFIGMKQGIPHKSELVFQELYRNATSDEDKIARLIKAQISFPIYEGMPANVFVEKLATNIASRGNLEMSKLVGSWTKNQSYRKRQGIDSFTVLDNISKLLENEITFNDGLISLKEYLASTEFVNGLETFNAWEVSKSIARVLERNFDEGLLLLEGLFDLTDMTINQQIALCGSLGDISETKIDLLKSIYLRFVKPKFDPMSNVQVVKKFPFNSARESLMRFDERLAKSKLFDEALWLLLKFIDDPDPSPSGANDKDDPKGEFNKHKQIIEGSDLFSIDTVRGWAAWVLQQFIIVGGEKYVSKVIDLVDRLSKDGNYYIRLQACIPLAGLMRNRNSVLPNTNKRFMSIEDANKVESIAFTMLDSDENKKLYAIMKNLAMVFSYMRTLGTHRALKVLKEFKDLEFNDPTIDNTRTRGPKISQDPYEGVIREVASLFIYYAEFRRDLSKNTTNASVYGQATWKEITEFDDRPFKRLLMDILETTTPSVRSHFAWHFWRLPKEPGIDVNRAFSISNKYIRFLIAKYHHEVYDDVYHFIGDNIETKFGECFKIWTSCIKNERKYFKTHAKNDSWKDMYWWPYHHNGAILCAIYDKLGADEFIKWFSYLLGYPKKIIIANDLDQAVNILARIAQPRNKIEKMFQALVVRNPQYLNVSMEWKKK